MTEENAAVKAEKANLVKSQKLRALTPSVDIYENSEEILLFADLPGVKKDDITIDLDNGQLTLVGNRYMDQEKDMQLEEFGSAQFRRVFSVPQGIDQTKVDAELNEGVLKLHLPKSESVKPRRIEVRQG
ncbi:MAG: Hsp20/alpha crystallin family protein [Desulfobulbaceae bacterium]|jgi:HSP20 family molecular chaperone IbpA|nr:MAG: Hsp20/alpha crystallin family protein [Desulfobulbaceae bacterium]